MTNGKRIAIGMAIGAAAGGIAALLAPKLKVKERTEGLKAGLLEKRREMAGQLTEKRTGLMSEFRKIGELTKEWSAHATELTKGQVGKVSASTAELTGVLKSAKSDKTATGDDQAPGESASAVNADTVAASAADSGGVSTDDIVAAGPERFVPSRLDQLSRKTRANR